MNGYKEKHIEKKNEILQCLNEAKTFFKENQFEHEANVMADNIQKLESGEFSIVVVGEFSAGKSTLLNALMGEKILPSFTDETTATVNYLRHKEHSSDGESGEVVYKDGSSEKIYSADLKTVSKYVCTESDVEVAKNVDHLDLYLDSKFLEGNVTLVDTPGLNGIAEGHKEITMEQIERSSAGIFMFNANKPGSRSDFEFLTELRKNVDGSSIILLLNMIDTIKKSEGETVETVIEKLKENYRKVYPDVKTMPEIWPVAAYPALIARSKKNNFDYNGKAGNFSDEEKKKFEELSRMKAFENRLWKFLTQGEKAKQELLAPVGQLSAQLTSLKKDLNVQLDILNGSVDKDAIEEQKLELNKGLDSLQEKLDSLTKGMKKEISDAEADFLHEVRAEMERFSNNYSARIMDFENIEELDPIHVEKRIKEKFKKIVTDAYENYCERIRDIMATSDANLTEELNCTLSDDMNIKISSELEIKSVKIGLEDFEKNCVMYKEQIKEQEQIINAEEDNLLKVMAAKRRKDNLKQQLEQKQEAMQEFERNFQEYMPKGTKKQGEPRVLKVGLFKKQLYYPEVLDTSDRDQYLAEQSKIRQRREAEILNLEKKLNEIPDSEVEARQKALARKEEKRNELKAELDAYQEKFAQDIKEKCKIALAMAKRKILDYLNDVKEDYLKDVKKDFASRRKIQLDIMEQLIGQSVISKIEIKKKEIEILENKLKDAVDQRDSSVRKLNEQLEGVNSLMKKALNLESDIESIRVDKIKEQDI